MMDSDRDFFSMFEEAKKYIVVCQAFPVRVFLMI